jgi:hypothetical protein
MIDIARHGMDDDSDRAACIETAARQALVKLQVRV